METNQPHYFCIVMTFPGARDDLEKVTRMAYSMVCEYGMSPVIGHVSVPIKGKGRGSKVIYSDKLSKEIDRVGDMHMYPMYYPVGGKCQRAL